VSLPYDVKQTCNGNPNFSSQGREQYVWSMSSPSMKGGMSLL